MAQHVEVELIPWIHHVESATHIDVIKYIQSLPRNSVLGAMELSLEEYEILKGMSVREVLNARVSDSRAISPLLSLVELLHECRKRNIQIVPLEGSLIKNIIDGANNAREFSQLALKVSPHKEKTAATQIKIALQYFKGRKFPAVIPTAHVLAVKTALEKIGIAANVNTKIFRDKQVVERIITLFAEESRLRAQGRVQDAKLRLAELKELTAIDTPQERTERYWQVIKKIKKREAEQKIRRTQKRRAKTLSERLRIAAKSMRQRIIHRRKRHI